MVFGHKEFWVAKGFQWTHTKNNLLSSTFRGLDLPIQLVRIKCSWLRLYLIPVCPQANELKWISKQRSQSIAFIESKTFRLKRAKADA